MVRASKWSLALAAVAVLGLGSTMAARLSAQDAPKTGGTKQDGPKHPAGPAQAPDREARQEEMKQRMAKLRDAVATAKTTLPAAIATAETAGKGKAFRAVYSFDKDGKFVVEVGVIVGDKMGTVTVDSDSGKTVGEIRFEGEGHNRGPEGRGGEKHEKAGGGGEKKEGGGN